MIVERARIPKRGRRHPSAIARRVRARQAALNRRGRKAVLNGELKFHDLEVTDAAVAAGAVVQAAILTIPEGNGESDRIGRKITIRKIGWRLTVTLPSTATAASTSDVIRVILGYDKQANLALPTNTDVLEAATFRSFNNLANSARFRILMDRTYDLKAHSGSGRGSTDTLSYGEDVIDDSFFKDVNLLISYNNSATTGVITSITSGNLFVIYCSRDGLGGVASTMRVRFSDN